MGHGPPREVAGGRQEEDRDGRGRGGRLLRCPGALAAAASALALLLVPIQAQGGHPLLIAGLFVAAGYTTLTCYDFFALRTIGCRHVPYRIAALAAFTSYSIGHNLGATVLTGGVVRFRIYSTWGLSVIDVAKMAFVTGLTFWLGNAFVLGLGMAYAPDAASAVNQLPPWLNRTIALTGLAAIVGYMLWLVPRPRLVGYGDWQITLPNAALTFVQIGIGIADLTIGALAMYALLPGEPAIDFSVLLVTFVLATLIGFLSHAPGSLGVFDAAMLVGLSQLDKNELLSARREIQLIFQDSASALNPYFSVGETIAEPLVIHRWGPEERIRTRVHELLEQVELPASLLPRHPQELSGGQRQRISIARALLKDSPGKMPHGNGRL